MAVRRIRKTKSLARKTKSLARKSAELAIAAPQVISHRVARIALATPTLSDHDRKEFQMMVHEKHTTFAESWNAMAMQMIRTNQTLAASLLRVFLNPTLHHMSSAATVAVHVHNAAIDVLSAGLAPVHRIATSNARRLVRTA